MSALSICFLSRHMASVLDPSLPPRHGGAEVQLYLLACELAKDNRFSVHFMVDDIPAASRECGLHLHVFPQMITRGLPFLSRFENRRRRIGAIRATQCDWLLQSGASQLTLDAASVAGKLGLRFVHLLSSDADVGGRKLDARPKVRDAYLESVRQADVVLSQHEQQKAQLAELGLDSVILPPGFRVPEANTVMPRDYVLWVASCQPLKQPELYVELSRRIPESRFVMVMTPREPRYFEQVSSLVSTRPNIQLLAGVPDVGPVYAQAKALVNLSTYEGFPNTFLEAALQRTPIFSLNVDPDGMLSRFGAGHAANGDFDDLANRLGQVLGDATQWEQLSQGAYEYAASRHDIKKTVEVLKGQLLMPRR